MRPSVGTPPIWLRAIIDVAAGIPVIGSLSDARGGEYRRMRRDDDETAHSGCR